MMGSFEEQILFFTTKSESHLIDDYLIFRKAENLTRHLAPFFFFFFFFFWIGKFLPHWNLNLEPPTNSPQPFTTCLGLKGRTFGAFS